jgi:hypothetical protein
MASKAIYMVDTPAIGKAILCVWPGKDKENDWLQIDPRYNLLRRQGAAVAAY